MLSEKLNFKYLVVNGKECEEVKHKMGKLVNGCYIDGKGTFIVEQVGIDNLVVRPYMKGDEITEINMLEDFRGDNVKIMESKPNFSKIQIEGYNYYIHYKKQLDN